MADVSVVVPTHGRPASLARLLASLPPEPEVVVVDDGSPTDDVVDVVAGAGRPVRLLRQERRGPAAARNAGWRAASGDRIVFVDDDCVALDGAITTLAAALDDAAGAGARIEPLPGSGLVGTFMHLEGLVRHKVVDGDVRWLVTAGVAFRRDALEATGGFDERFFHGGEDADLTMRLQQRGYPLRYVAGAVFHHDHRPDLVSLVRTYYRHGTGQRLLLAHDGRATSLKRSARERVDPRAWAAVYRGYRREVPAPTAAACLVLRAGMMLPWLIGAARG